MFLARFIGACAAACLGLAAEELQDAAALVQSTLQLPGVSDAQAADASEDPFEEGLGSLDAQLEEEPVQYFVDNSNMHHRGPGVMYRLSKNVSHIAGKDHYAAWGSTVSGVSAGDGWVKVGERYLPTMVHGVLVLVKKDVRRQPQYEPTRLMTPDGGWVPCNITGLGTKPDSYSVTVTPATVADYVITDVPATMLERVEHVLDPAAKRKAALREAVEAKVAAKLAAVKLAAKVAAKSGSPARPEEESDIINVKVRDSEGNAMELKHPKKSPLRALMSMACARADIRREKCQTDVTFMYRGVEIDPSDTHDVIGLQNGATINMLHHVKPSRL